MAKAKRQAVKPIPNPRTAQQPVAQTGAELMKAIANLIPAAGPLMAEAGSDVNRQAQSKRKGRGK